MLQASRTKSCQQAVCCIPPRKSPKRVSAPASSYVDRRALLGIALTSMDLISAAPARANPVVDFWRSRQRQNGGGKLIAPIKVAQARLQEANILLHSTVVTSETVVEALKSVRGSSLNCYVFDAMEDDDIETQASLLTQQMKLADPCTFRIIVKTITSFAPQYMKDQGKALVEDVIAMYRSLDKTLSLAAFDSSRNLDASLQQLSELQAKLVELEEFVREVLSTE